MYSYHHFNPCLPSSNMLQLRQERDEERDGHLECKIHHFLDDEQNVNGPSNACFLLLHPSNDHQPTCYLPADDQQAGLPPPPHRPLEQRRRRPHSLACSLRSSSVDFLGQEALRLWQGLVGPLQGGRGGDGRALGLRVQRAQPGAEFLEVLRAGGQDGVPAQLAVLGGLALQVAPQAQEALGVRAHGRVEVADGADHGLGDGGLVELPLLQVLGRALVDLQRLLQVGVAVAQEAEHARDGVEPAEAAVGPAHHAHVVPQVPRAQEAAHHLRAPLDGLALPVQLAAVAHVVDLRGHHETLVLRRQQLGRGRPVARGRRALGHLGQEVAQGRVRGGQHLLAAGQVDDGVLLLQDGRADGLQAGLEGGPVVLGLLQQAGQRRRVAEAARQLLHGVGRGVARVDAVGRELVPGRDHAHVHLRLGLAQDLHRALLVPQVGVGQHGVHEPEEVAGALGHGLAAQEQVRVEAVRGRHHEALGVLLADHHAGADAARQRAHLLVESDAVQPAGAGLAQQPREQRQQRRVRQRHRAQAQAHVRVQDARGVQRVRHHRHALPLLHLDGDLQALAVQVLQGELGQRGLGLRRVLGRLRRHQLLLLLDHLQHVGLAHGLLDGRQPRRLLLQLRRLQRPVRPQLHRRPVPVVQQHLPQQVLEHGLARSQVLLERAEGLLELELLGGVLVVDPVAHGAQHEGEPPGEGARVELAHLELLGVHGRGHRLLGEALRRAPPQGVQHQRLHLVHVSRAHALEAGAEGVLQQRVVQPAADELRAQPGLVQRALEHGGGRAAEQVVQHGQGQALLGAQRPRVQQPVHRDHVLRLAAARLGREVLDDLPGLRPERLPGDGRGRGLRGRFELAQIFVQQLQPLGRVVVAVEVHPGVGRVVVLGVEALEVLEGQVWDGLGVPARVHRILVVREQRLLAGAAHERVRVAVHALHLVVHHALVGQRRLGALRLQVPPLLLEHQGVLHSAGKEHRVQVHVDQVVEVLRVLAGHRVAGAVRVGERVQEGLQGALQQVHKGLL
mmetsp:Transcript_48412/g.83155  ORF Transcript_48412/g.83155 Transcript_48412/m.83155 type:complete len:1015 (-) Transcript_48412:588-3632(-)